jgi:membrane-associated HD superfamily phosphohydrolase
MKISIKKRIAKEFLILTLTFFIVLISYISIFAYNSYYFKKIKVSEKNISKGKKTIDTLFYKEQRSVLSNVILPVRILDEKTGKKVMKNYNNDQDVIMFYRRNLYNVLSLKYDVGSFEYFCNKMNNNISRRKIYSIVRKDFNLGTLKEFDLKFKEGKNVLNELNKINNIRKEILKKENNISLEKEMIRYFKNSIISNKIQKEILSKIIYFLLIIFFGSRYVYFGIKWSLATLKS